MYCCCSITTRFSSDLFCSLPLTINSWKVGSGAVDDWVTDGIVDEPAVWDVIFDPVPENVPDGNTPEGITLPEGKMPDEVTVPDGDETTV